MLALALAVVVVLIRRPRRVEPSYAGELEETLDAEAVLT
jgi:hypothetical protein